MNQKKTKLIRKQLRAKGVEPTQVAYSKVFNTVILVEGCGRQQYQQAKLEGTRV